MSSNAKHLHSIDAGHYKNTAKCETEVMPIPDVVKISMSQHIGAPCKPLVAKGDAVKVGQLIGDTDAFVVHLFTQAYPEPLQALKHSVLPQAETTRWL